MSSQSTPKPAAAAGHTTTDQRAPRMGLPDLGVGVGLRIPHYAEIFADRPHVDWFEIISENFLVDGGRPRYNLDRAREAYRLVQHGVSMNIGGPDPLDMDFLKRLRKLGDRTGTPWFSDHLCWTGFEQDNFHELIPLPYTEEAVAYVAERARIVQEVVGRPFCLENVSSYMTYTDSSLTEWEFLNAVAQEADIGLLLDVNNVYVAAYNHRFDPATYIDSIEPHRVVQMHLAGHENNGTHIIDTHDDHVIDEVWALYRRACERFGDVSTLIEWDANLPTFAELMAEAEKARAIRDDVRVKTASSSRAISLAESGHG